MTKEYECPECKDTGWLFYSKDNGYEYAKKCKCMAVREARKKLERSGLAKEFKGKSFEDYYTHNNPKLMDAKDTAEHYVEKFDETKDTRFNSLLLCGQVGAGKTHLGTACSVSLIDKGIAVVYMGYREEMTLLKSQVTDSEIYTSKMHRYKEATVLFIDDFLKGKVTEAGNRN